MIEETITITELLIRLKDAFNRGVKEGPNLKGSDFTNSIFNRVENTRLLQENQFSKSVIKGIQMMSALQAEDQDFYDKLHKGTPYYYIATAAFLSHDYDTATYFFNAAAEEDLRDGANPKIENDQIDDTSPALKFMLLQGEKKEQWAKQLTEIAEDAVSTCLHAYGNSVNDSCALNMTEIRNQFILPSIDLESQDNGLSKLRPIICSLISFVLEWEYKRSYLNLYPATKSFFPFFNHLFKGCVIFESLLKTSPNNYQGTDLDKLKSEIPWIDSRLKINSQSVQGIINQLPDGQSSIRTSIQITCKLRNTTGHKINWVVDMNGSKYDLLVQQITSSIFHAIAKEFLNK